LFERSQTCCPAIVITLVGNRDDRSLLARKTSLTNRHHRPRMRHARVSIFLHYVGLVSNVARALKMPIVVLVASTLAFWVIYWFIRMGGVNHFHEQSARRKEEARRAQAREKERTAPLRAIDDPRDAATVLMLLIPRGRDPTARQIATIEETMRAVFGYDHDMNERLTHARFIAGFAQSFEQATGLFADLFNKRLTAEERHELVGLVEKIAQIDGPSAIQTEEIGFLKRRVGLAPVE
jgi:hypothetical protein